MKRTVIIQIKDSRIFFNESVSLELNRTNLPVEHFRLSERTVYWELIMKGYDNNLACLEVVVVDYNSNKSNVWHTQAPKKSVDILHFLHLDWSKFENCLSYYDGHVKGLLPYNANYIDIKPLPKPVTLVHKVSIRNLSIGDGYVKYSKKVKWSREPIEFTIKHVDMIPQLEYVKPYFAKILGKKTIDVEVTVWKENSKMIIGTVRSSDIAKINRETLYVIKGFQIDKFKKLQKSKFRDSILITDENAEHVKSDFGNIDSFEKEILFHLLEKDDVRNRPQLQFLSEIMDKSRRLMITIEPQFGFVFTIIGAEMIHVIWELIDSHATYIWSFENRSWSESIIKTLETEFNIITTHGRSHYRNFFEAKNGVFLNVVNHSISQNPMVNHFGEWRIHIERLLV